MPTAFISGHMDLTQDQFKQHYQEAIERAIAAGHSFVVGNAYGTDAFALHFLVAAGIDKDRVTVYYHNRDGFGMNRQLTVESIKNKMGFDRIVTGYASFESRDAEMTRVSDYDIAWVRPANETRQLMRRLGKTYRPNRMSGTEKNLIRRQTQQTTAQQDPGIKVVRQPSKPVAVVGSLQWIKEKKQ